MIKKITEKKTTLPSLRNEDWKKVKAEPEEVNKFLPHIPMANTTKLIYAGVKVVCGKIGIPKEIWIEIQNLDGKLG